MTAQALWLGFVLLLCAISWAVLAGLVWLVAVLL